jgi:phosphatidylglycerol lysyltransferase
VRQGDKIVAFANVWQTVNKEELSVDLMRYRHEAPTGVMDYLFAKLMLWGAQDGYRWFNLGMAPLSGLENRSLAPLWNKAGSFVFRHGEDFYNFEGLRLYKEKFHPVWEPKYLAAPAGFRLPAIFANISTLISGGFSGLLAK